jgi:uncharacterized protein
MELTGTRDIAADRATVWAALNDPEVLQASIPGCQAMSGSPEDGFEATVKQKVGPVSATFKGAVQLSNVVPGESYTISGEGKGGAAGFAKGSADVRLEDAGDGTRLTYDVKASVGGKLAQLGSRIIDGFAKKMADQFFDNFRQKVEGPDAAAAEPATAEAAPAAAPQPAVAPEAPAPAAIATAVTPPPASGSAPAAPRPTPAPSAAPQAAKPAGPTAVPAREGLFERIKAWFAGLFGGKR